MFLASVKCTGLENIKNLFIALTVVEHRNVKCNENVLKDHQK